MMCFVMRSDFTRAVLRACVRVCVCAYACVRACLCVCVRACVSYRSKGVRNNSRRFTHISKKKVTTAADGSFIS